MSEENPDTPTAPEGEPTPDAAPDAPAEATAEDGGTIEHTFGGTDSPGEGEPTPGEGEAAPDPEHEHGDQDANPEHGANTDTEKAEGDAAPEGG